MTSDIESKLQTLKQEIAQKQAEIKSLKQQIPPVVVPDSLFQTSQGSVHLSELFGTHSELILVFNMGTHCPYCTLWADEYNGILKHLESRVSFVVSSPNKPDTQAKFAKKRNWQFRMVQSEQGFRQKLGFEQEDKSLWPGYVVFTKDASGQIKQVNKDFFGPGDNYSSVWHYFEHLPDYANDWQPRFEYKL